MGQCAEEQFDEFALKQMIKEFLAQLSKAITGRNSQLEVPSTYLKLIKIEISIII